VYIKFIVTLK